MAKYLDFLTHSYSKAAYAETTDTLISNAEMQLIGQGIQFDSMVGVGNSGLLVLPILARHFNVPFFALRKSGIKHHNRRNVYGDGIIGQRWILIDDVKVLGGTIEYANKTIRQLAEASDFETQYVGTYLYEPMNGCPGEFLDNRDRPKCVQKIEVDGIVSYVNYAMYTKVREIQEHCKISCSELTLEVSMRYPEWDINQIDKITTSIT